MKINLIVGWGIITFLTGLSGCKSVKISDGEVPARYLAEAKTLQGTYHGHFNRVRGDLIVRFDGNRPVLTYKNKNGQDIFNNNCYSEIGALREVDVKGEGENLRITSAIFDFNPGNCRYLVQDNTLRIDFIEGAGGYRLEASILQNLRNRPFCYGAPPDRALCPSGEGEYYFSGVFDR